MSDLSMRNRLLWRGDPGYEAARLDAVWNDRKPDRSPDVIVVVESEGDVVEAVNLARSRGLRVAVRGGGHSWCGSPVRNGGMLVDLSRLTDMSIDPTARTAVVQPAVSARDLAAALARHGLAFPVGHCGSVPLSGYLLAGGSGWNRGVWGPACFSVQAIELVTADGDLITADETANSDFFWAARGAGPGFFGVVTRFHIRVYDLPKAIRTSTFLYPFSEVEEVSRWAAAVAPSVRPSVEMLVLLRSAPPGAPAGPAGKVVVVTATAFAESEAAAAESLAVLETYPGLARALLRQTNQPSSFEMLHETIGSFLPEGHRFAADTVWSNDDLSTVLPQVAEQLVTAPSVRSLMIATMPPRPPAGHVLPDAAFSMVGRTLLLCYAIWDDEGDDAVNERWLRDAVVSVESWTIGHYIAEADLEAGPSRSARSFASANWERLQALKRTHDPDDLFHTYLGID